MRWIVYPIDAYPGNLWSDWQLLAQRYHANNPMLGACFAQRLSEHFGDIEKLHVLAGKVDGSTVALALFEPGGFGRWRSFRPSQAQAALIVGAPELRIDPSSLLAAFPGHAMRLDVFALDPREHQPFLVFSNVTEQASAAHNICVDLSGDFDAYWEDRPRNLKKNLRRYRHRIQDELGELRCLVASDPADVATATDRYGLLESRGWKGEVGTALHPGNIQGSFYRSFMIEMATQSRAYVFELYANELLLASRLCVTGDALLVILKTTFDERFKRYAVGRLLLHDVLQYTFEKQLAKVVDFYTDASSDQINWATSERSMVHCSIYRSLIAKWIYLGLASSKKLAKLVVAR